MEQTMPDRVSPPAVAAVLAQTPTNPDNGKVTASYWTSSGSKRSYPVEGDPEPIAARQSVAVHNDIADFIAAHRSGFGGYDADMIDLIVQKVRERAAEIEAQYSTEGAQT
jgi:hypothetical protein